MGLHIWNILNLGLEVQLENDLGVVRHVLGNLKSKITAVWETMLYLMWKYLRH